MLFTTSKKVYFFVFVLLALDVFSGLSAKAQESYIGCASHTRCTTHWNHCATHILTKKNSETVLAAGFPFLNNTSPSIPGNSQRSIMDYILVISILLIQTIIVVICFFHRKNLVKRKQLATQNQAVLKFQLALAERYIEREKARHKELEQQLELVNKQLTSYAFNYQQKNKIIAQLQEIVEKLEATTSSAEKNTLINDVKKLAKENLVIDKNWEYFRNFFEETQFGFNAKLLSKHPKLKPNDLKMCALIRLNLNIKETAKILGISPGSVKTSRYRLRKKLGLESKDEIIDYLMTMETEGFVNTLPEVTPIKPKTSEQM